MTNERGVYIVSATYQHGRGFTFRRSDGRVFLMREHDDNPLETRIDVAFNSYTNDPMALADGDNAKPVVVTFTITGHEAKLMMDKDATEAPVEEGKRRG